MPNSLHIYTLPDDLQWVDEFTWLPVAQQVEVTFGGSVIVEESAQLAGRPITLQSGQDRAGYFGMATRELVTDLRALAASPLAGPIVLTLEDGRTFNVRFRYGDGAAVEATPWKPYGAYVAGDYYSLTLRLMQV
jgi:hypothetical protein